MDPQIRVGDAEREQAVEELRRYAAAGFLSLEEFSQRSASAYEAKTHGELAAVTRQLPAGAAPDRRPNGEASGRRRWSALAIALAAVAGVVAVAFAAMIVFMIVMMMGGVGGMDGMP